MPRSRDDPRLDETTDETPTRAEGPTRAQAVPHAVALKHAFEGGPAPELVAELDEPTEEVPEERGLPTEEPDLSAKPVKGMIPIYNPLPYAFELPYGGQFFTVRAGGIDLVPEVAADHAVGPENCGGAYSRFGLRRLYCPEPRFEEAAKRDQMSVPEWVAQRNAQIRAEAETAYSAYSGELPSIQGFAGMIPPPPEE